MLHIGPNIDSNAFILLFLILCWNEDSFDQPVTTFNPRCSERIITASALSAHGSSLRPHWRLIWIKLYPHFIRFWIGFLIHISTIKTFTSAASREWLWTIFISNEAPGSFSLMDDLSFVCFVFFSPLPESLNISTSLYIYISTHFRKSNYKLLRQLDSSIDLAATIFRCLLLILLIFIFACMIISHNITIPYILFALFSTHEIVLYFC